MNLLHFDSERSWVDGVSALWRDRLRNKPDLKMCLPTGLTPLPVYAEMVRSARAGQVSFARASVFALDEFGGIPQSHPGSTRHTLLRLLLSQVDLQSTAFHYLDADAPDFNAVCARYDAAIGDGFDLVILGIGTNGHLGMNEPGSTPDSPTRRVDLEESTVQASARYFPTLDPARLPRWGLTVGLGAILASREVWVLATGAGKADIVERTISGAVTTDVPASLLQGHPRCSVFVDGPASGRLPH
jgi:glucosamine-6-phosphate deaminase